MGFQRWASFMAIAFLVSLWTSGQIAGTPVRSEPHRSQITAVCPLNQTEFSEASQRMNCTGNTRYLCAPNADLSALVEFCSVAPRLPYGPDNCVTLQSNGYLNHVSCNSTFEDGCPDVLYFDDEIFKFPKCLLIDTVQKCFLADRQCRYIQSTTSFEVQNTTRDESNHTSSPRDENGQHGSSRLLWFGLLAFIPVIVLVAIIVYCSSKGVKRDSFSEQQRHLLPNKTDETDEEYEMQESRKGVKREDQEQLLQNETDEREENENLECGKETTSELHRWCTPYREYLNQMLISHLTVLYSLLFLRNNRIELKSKEEWLSALNKVRSKFGLKKVPEEKGEEIAKETFSKLPALKHADDIWEVPSDLLSEIFWNFYRQEHLKLGLLDFFLDNADRDTVAEFCRTYNYPTVPTERCVCLPENHTEKLVEKLGHKILSHPTMEDQSIHEMISKKFEIPMEVLSWGKDGIQRFIAYLNKEKEPVYHTRGMIIGCAGAGKTTLIKRLQGFSLEEIMNVKKTRGIDVHPAIFKVENKQLKGNKSKTINHFNFPQAKICNFDLSTEKERRDSESISDEDDLETNTEMTATNTNTETEKSISVLDSPIPQANTVPESSNTDTQTSKELPSFPSQRKIERQKNYRKTSISTEYTLKPLLRSLKNVTFDGERSAQYLTLLDFAGQSAYYACHQIYFSARAFYILVMDMSKDLNAVVGEEVCDHNHTVFETWRYRDFYTFWMKSIHTYSSQKAPVILVATHAEGKEDQDIEEFTKKVFDILGRDLLKEHQARNSIFTLTLPNESTDEVEGVDEIKQCIIETMESQPYWGANIPSSWVIFEKEIMKRKESLKIMKIEKLHALCESLSVHVPFQPKQMKDALRFFNDIGLILYFDSANLEETVILDVQWFVDSFKNIITDDQQVRFTRTNAESWKQFYHTGELDDRLLESIWREAVDFGESFLDNKNDLLNYMQHLGLLARGSEETNNVHLIPCMTKRSIPGKIIRKYAQDHVFSYRFDFFPNFIFWRFVVACVCSTGWAILTENGHKCIFKDSCILKYNTVDVLIKVNNNILDVQIHGLQTSSVGLKIKILKNIRDILQKLTKTFHKEITFTTGCRCKPTKIFELGSAKFLSAVELWKMRCSSCRQCSACKRESHPVAIQDLSVILEENEELHGYQQIEMSSNARKSLRKTRTESEGQDMEFGVDDVEHLMSIKNACLSGHKEQFDHELQKLKKQKEILLSADISLLHIACEGGNVAIVQILIKEGFKLDSKINGRTVLHIASKHGRLAICDYVLSQNPNLLKTEDNREGNSAHYAAEGGYIEILEYLVEKGIDPLQLTKTKRNILHIAASNGHHDLCKHILETYPKLLNSVDFHGWNALHCAASQGHVEIFDLLVESKVDVKAKSTRGDTVLHIACLKSRQEMCERILRTWPELIKEQNILGRTPIFSAAEGGELALLKLLRDHDADEDEDEDEDADNHTLLHVASEHLRYEICEYLVEKFPDMANKLTKKGWNALHMLAAGPSKEEEDEIMVFKLLVKHGLKIHQTTINGSSILKLACKNRKKKLCMFMMKKHPTLLNIPNVDHLKTAKETNDNDMIELFETYCQQI